MKIFAVSIFFLTCFGTVYTQETLIKKADTKTVANETHNKDSNEQHLKTGKLIIYKDSSVASLPLFFESNKDFSLLVAGSIDPKSVLFHQNCDEQPQYTIANPEKEKDVPITAELILNSSTPFDGEITYYFSGISWNMHYVVEINEQFNVVKKFNGFVNINNQSGVDFEKATLRLVDAKTDSLAKNQIFNEYFIFKPKTIRKNSVTRIPWITIKDQKAEQDYRLDVGGENLTDMQGAQKYIPLQIWLGFKLKKELSKDLASGDIEIYISDSENTIRPLGKSTILTTKTGDDVQLGVPPHLLTQLKDNQDSPLAKIQGELEQTDYKTLLTEKVTEAAYRLTVRNFGEKDVIIKVMLPFGKNRGKVIRESMAHKQESGQSVYWPIKVPPKAEVMLRYRVQLMKE